MKALKPYCPYVTWAMQSENLCVARIFPGKMLVPRMRSRCCYSDRCTLVDVLVSMYSYRYLAALGASTVIMSGHPYRLVSIGYSA